MRFIATLALMLSACLSNAQTFKANINDLAFMAGKWVVAHEWGDMEEYWGEPLGNDMISSYRCVKNGKILFYEFVVIEQTDSVPVMILRHFKPGNIAREDQEHPYHYPLVGLDKNKAVFKSVDSTVKLTYELISENKLDVTLEEKNKEGKTETTAFHYTRK